MAPLTSLLSSLLALLPATLAATDFHKSASTTCHIIQGEISNSSSSAGVFFPGSAQYANAISHWANSSSQQSACAFVPASVHDISTAIKILGNTRTPFGVKSGGHAINPAFSSTPGVEISLSNFREITVDSKTSTVRLGPGLVWEDVYTALGPQNLNVLGGRVSGHVGISGFISGGGYSWHTNQHGLTVDSVVAFDLVLPNGTFVEVTDAAHPDLFFALKGGQSNFGIITAFTLQTFPQGLVWGGVVGYTGDKSSAIAKAVADFNINNIDPKACIIPVYAFAGGAFTVSMLLFYDAPAPPQGLFDPFFAINSTFQDISARSMLSLIEASPFPPIPRATFHTVSLLNWTESILDMVANETTFWGNKLASNSITLVSYDVEPLLSSYISHSTPSAYPHTTSLQPLNLYWTWSDPAQNQTITDAMKTSANTIYEAALAAGQDISIETGHQIRYPNYCMWDMPLAQMYGSNVQTLHALRGQYDPEDVMGLSGGFRF